MTAITPYTEVWQNLTPSPAVSHPVHQPQLAPRRAISVVPDTTPAGHPQNVKAYWAVDIDTSAQVSKEILAVRDGVVLYGANGDGSNAQGYSTAYSTEFGTPSTPVPGYENIVMLGIRAGTSYVVVVYSNLTTITADCGLVSAGDVLGTATSKVTIGAYIGSVLTYPLSTVNWYQDPLRTVFPPDILWTRRPAHRSG